MNIVKPLVLGLLAVVVLTAPAHAQESLVDAATLEARVLAETPIRAELSNLLATDEVRRIAEERGIDLAEVAAAARTLSDARLEAAAPLVERATEALERRNTVTISVYTIIIFLLILILIT